MNTPPTVKAVFTCGFLLLVAGCSTPQANVGAAMRENGFVPYIPPQGDPTNYAGWNNYGPGVIIDAKSYNSQRNAERNLGATEVNQIMTDANDPKKRTKYAAFSNKKTSGNDFDASGGWSISAAAKVAGSLNLKNATTVDLKFGDTWISIPLDYEGLSSALRQQHAVITPMLRKRLASTRSQLIFKTIYTDSLTIYFKKSTDGGGEISLKIPMQDQDKLGGHFQISSDGGVTISGPIIIG